uniref:3-dehydroquinate synthase n=1 Tax=mine drainage metagenome TaxID=410659 RepID=E6PD80_9ZZZZ
MQERSLVGFRKANFVRKEDGIQMRLKIKAEYLFAVGGNEAIC